MTVSQRRVAFLTIAAASLLVLSSFVGYFTANAWRCALQTRAVER